MGVTVATPLCAGRLKAENLVSRVRHAEIKLVTIYSVTEFKE